MILPDVNVLIHAHNLDSPHHEAARAWWDATLSGVDRVALPWVAILGFVRITTNRAILTNPWTVDEALQRVEAWLERPNVRIVHPTEQHARLLAQLLRALGIAGNLTTDAHLAALAIEHGCTVYTTDADFSRFASLKRVNPLRS
ncbi:MAG: type II toxin-antitoxin system VapC family toxin [Actinomycetota bacterium]